MSSLAAQRETKGYHYKGSTHTHTQSPRKTYTTQHIDVPLQQSGIKYLSRLFSHYVSTCINASQTALKHTHISQNTLQTPSMHYFIGLTTNKLSLKHIFSQNITSCRVQLEEVIITFVEVVELSAVSNFQYSGEELCSHPTFLFQTQPEEQK